MAFRWLNGWLAVIRRIIVPHVVVVAQNMFVYSYNPIKPDTLPNPSSVV